MRLPELNLTSPSSLQNADGIKALLDKLKSSEAWQQTIAASDPPPPPAPATPASRGDASIQPSIASLLAQLADARAGGHPPPPPSSGALGLGRSPAPDFVPPQTSTGADKHDLHTLPFQQTLSHLALLSTKPGVIESIRRVRHHAGNQSANLC